MSAHTPGPWVAKGDEVVGTHSMRFNLTTAGTPVIAHVCKHEDTEGGFPYEANARLIAAAPELLDFAIAFVDLFNGDPNSPLDQSMLGQARAAIARAKGEQP